jgi:hypothetical protein
MNKARMRVRGIGRQGVLDLFADQAVQIRVVMTVRGRYAGAVDGKNAQRARGRVRGAVRLARVDAQEQPRGINC